MTDLLRNVVKWAERYEWLRNNPAWETEAFLSDLSAEQFDQAVDWAMAAQKLPKEGTTSE